MIKHINKIAIEVLRDRFADYDWHSNHYDEEYRMIVKALGLAKNNESLHDVSKCLKCEPTEYYVENIRYFKCKHCSKEMK